MKKFVEHVASKFTWNRAYWTAIVASWVFMVASWLLPNPFAFATLAPMVGCCAFAVFAGWMNYKEERAR